MSKRIILVCGVLLALAAPGFAAGQNEGPPRFGGEPLSLEGTLRFQNRAWPELETAAGTYRLMVPHYLPAGVEIAEGDRISVEGYEVPGPRMGRQKSDEKYLAVTKAVIGGEEYRINRPFGSGAAGPACREDEEWGPSGGRYGHHGYGHHGYGHHGYGRPGYGRGGPGFGWSRS